jgi:APA family basic amino acid/polyamine antiporter
VPRPYRARGHPWTTGLVLAGSIAFLAGAVVQDTANSLLALGLLLASYPVFRAVRGAAGRVTEVPAD